MRYPIVLAASLTALGLVIFGLALLTQSPDLHAVDFAGCLLLGGVIVALVLGPLVSVRFFVRRIEPWVIRWLGLDARARRGARVDTYVGAVGLLPVALFLAFVVGGSFGGATGESVSTEFGPIIGVGAGIFVIMLLITLLGATAGFVIAGYATKRLIKS